MRNCTATCASRLKPRTVACFPLFRLKSWRTRKLRLVTLKNCVTCLLFPTKRYSSLPLRLRMTLGRYTPLRVARPLAPSFVASARCPTVHPRGFHPPLQAAVWSRTSRCACLTPTPFRVTSSSAVGLTAFKRIRLKQWAAVVCFGPTLVLT